MNVPMAQKAIVRGIALACGVALAATSPVLAEAGVCGTMRDAHLVPSCPSTLPPGATTFTTSSASTAHATPAGRSIACHVFVRSMRVS